MPERKVIQPPQAPRPAGAYSPALLVAAVLAGVGATLAGVVNATAHLADIGLFERFNSTYAEAFPDPKPARTTVGSRLAEGMLVEIAVIARIGLSG